MGSYLRLLQNLRLRCRLRVESITSLQSVAEESMAVSLAGLLVGGTSSPGFLVELPSPQ